MPVWLVLAQLGATAAAADAPMAPPRGRASFADEFSGRAVSDRDWRFDTERNAKGWHNNELQYYAHPRTPANARVERGALVIEAHRGAPPGAPRDWNGQLYTSARLVTRRRLGYGFYEVRAKLPCARGTWPAIWMLPRTGAWPEQGEIDVMEMVGWDANTVHATLHSGKYNHRLGTQRGAQVRVPTACTAWHRYQLDWRPDAITIGVDGRGYMRVAKGPGDDRGAWPFDRPFDLILNLAVGGDWGGKQGVDDAAFPQAMRVDYVRYWAAPVPGSPCVRASSSAR